MSDSSASDTIYLDHAATTALDPEVLRFMTPYLTNLYGNPSSIYRLGQESLGAIDAARGSVARVLRCTPGEIIFTSGGTESDNLALRGVAWQARLQHGDEYRPHIITTRIEHHAVLYTAAALERQGFAVTYLPVNDVGIVSIDQLEGAFRPETCLVSVMYANNETGAVQPIKEIARLTKERGVPFHVDAVQAAGLLSLDVQELGCDLLSLSAHKFYGPKGTGVLYARRGISLEWQQEGGGQESGRRAGTENVPGIAGLGFALAKAEQLRPAYAAHCGSLRDELEAAIIQRIPDARVNGPIKRDVRLPNSLNIGVPGIQGETVLLGLDMEGVAASAGSACTTGNSEPSHVLEAMGLNEAQCRASLRFTVGRDNFPEQMMEVADILEETVSRVRNLAGSAV